MTVIVRFAPSPTGRLHIGNIRPAVLNWLFAHKHGGTFILRLDDTDRARSTEAFAAGIEQDLAWLGLAWQRRERQSDRTERYQAAADRLKASGRLYPCTETEDELDRRRKRQLARGQPPIYDRAALKLADDERSRIVAEGRATHWRFRLANHAVGALEPKPSPITWTDLVRGPQSIDLGSLSDPVLVRADGTFLYTFTSVVDDIDFAISHVIRGEDHVANTAVQLDLFRALGAEPPAFAHHSLLIGADGQALSKRLGALSVEGLRAAGLEPMAVVCHAALLGTSEAVAPYATLAELAALLDLAKVSRAPGRFDLAELHQLNARLLHLLPYTAVSERLRKITPLAGEAFWLAVRGNLHVLGDAAVWADVISGRFEPMPVDPAFCRIAAEVLPAEPWSADTWGLWTNAIKARTGAKGRALFHPLRLVLTAREAGPELKLLLPLIGRAEVLRRLAGTL